MIARRLHLLLVLVAFAACMGVVFAAKKPTQPTQKGTPLVDSFLDSLSPYGVTGDGVGTGIVFEQPVSGIYANGDNGLQVYIGGSGRDANLVTYNSGRKLHIVFNTSSPAWQAANEHSGLPAEVDAESDMYGINYQGEFTEGMVITDTGQMQMNLEFHVGRVTYKLDWASMGAIKLSNDTWLMTTDPGDLALFGLSYPHLGFPISPAATLSVRKRHSSQQYGALDMAMRYFIQLK